MTKMIRNVSYYVDLITICVSQHHHTFDFASIITVIMASLEMRMHFGIVITIINIIIIIVIVIIIVIIVAVIIVVVIIIMIIDNLNSFLFQYRALVFVHTSEKKIGD